ncbi:MAG: hypothetical protein J5755_01830, partial [Clostridia bacterium]|nr:hypothetical protein [Clostridia bacterium]
MQLDQLTFRTGGNALGEAAFTRVTDRLDEAGPDSLFVCIQGGHRDTHEDVALLERKGTAALVVERQLDTSIP